MGEYIGVNSWASMTHLCVLFASCLLLSKSAEQDGGCSRQGGKIADLVNSVGSTSPG